MQSGGKMLRLAWQQEQQEDKVAVLPELPAGASPPGQKGQSYTMM